MKQGVSLNCQRHALIAGIKLTYGRVLSSATGRLWRADASVYPGIRCQATSSPVLHIDDLVFRSPSL